MLAPADGFGQEASGFTPLRAVLAPLAKSTVSIEAAFLRVGGGLGRGLQIFAELNGSLSALSDELIGGGLASATVSLQALSRELVGVSSLLPQDSATLTELVASNAQVSLRLVRLIDNMRMMAILARSARIEAVVFDSKGAEYVDFTQEISTLTRRVQGDIETCAREHAKLSSVLATAAKAQQALERDYGSRLVELARELSDAFAAIQERRERGAALMQDVAARANGISQAAGAAIMSLQTGDSTRQRLEHVLGGMQAVVADPAQAEADPQVGATLVTMCRLQEAQLTDTVSSFGADLRSIDDTLQLLGKDTRELVALGRTVFGDASDGSDSFLASFRQRLADATRLIQTCQAARGSLEAVVSELRRMLDEMTEAVGLLNEVILEIVLIGVNAGLKARRLGTEGRSLVVIAHEVKELAAAISTDAKDLLPIVDTLQEVSRQLDRALPEDGQAVDIDSAMTATTRELELGGERLEACLKALESGGATFETELEQARQDFRTMGAMNRALQQVADTMQAVGAQPEPDCDRAAVADRIGTVMAGLYTMIREREIHAAIIGVPDRSAPAVLAAA